MTREYPARFERVDFYAGERFAPELQQGQSPCPNHHFMVLCLRSPGLNFVATRVRKGGDGLKPSISKMYFCDRDFNVYTLPLKFNGDFVKPEKMR